MRHSLKQVFKFSHCVGANGVALVTDQVVGHLLVFAQVHVEVVEPEIGHHLLKLGAGVNVAGEPLGNEFFGNETLGILECCDCLSLPGREIVVEGLALHRPQGLDECLEFFGLHAGEAINARLGLESENTGDCSLIELRLAVRGRGGVHVHLALGGRVCRVHGWLGILTHCGRFGHVAGSCDLLILRLRVIAWSSGVFFFFGELPGLDPVDLVLVDGVHYAVLRHLATAVYGLADDGVAGQVVHQLGGGPLHGRVLGQVGVQVGLVNGLGMKLAVEPFFQAFGADCFHIAGTRAEGEAIEGMDDAVIALQLGGLVLGPLRGFGGMFGGRVLRRLLGKAL